MQTRPTLIPLEKNPYPRPRVNDVDYDKDWKLQQSVKLGNLVQRRLEYLQVRVRGSETGFMSAHKPFKPIVAFVVDRFNAMQSLTLRNLVLQRRLEYLKVRVRGPGTGFMSAYKPFTPSTPVAFIADRFKAVQSIQLKISHEAD